MATDRKVVALVPMKGHSERIPGKNLKLMHGKPLCFWILETLFQVPSVDQVVVNTDSEELAATVTSAFPAVKIHRRPKEIQGDFVPMNAVLAYDLSQLPEALHFVQTHSTNPLLKPETLRRAIDQYFATQEEADSLFAVTRHQARFFDAQGNAINHNPAELLRTQDLPAVFEENSNFYIFSRESFARRQARIGDRARMYPMDALEALDIDDFAQWRMVEALLR